MKAYFILFVSGIFFSSLLFAQLEYLGPEGGYIQCMVTDNQENILASIRFGGIYKTTDFGENWDQIFYGYRNLDVRSLAVNSSNHYFAGTDAAGFFRSTNEGVTWEKINNILSTLTIQVLLITPNGDIYAGTFNGVYKSTDNGNTFLPASNGITTSSISALAFSGSYLFAGTYYAGIFRSGNGGESWDPINTGLDFNGRIVESIGFFGENSFVNKGTITNHAAISLGDKVYVSNDIWDVWSPITPPPGNVRKITITPVRNETRIVGAVITESGGVISININDPNGSWNQENAPEYPCGSLVIATPGVMCGYYGLGSAVSLDGLNTFNFRNNGMKSASISAIKSGQEYLLCGTEAGQIYESFDRGNNFQDITFNLTAGYVYDIARNPVSLYSVAATQNGTYGLINGGSSWQNLNFLSQTLDYNDAGTLFYGYGATAGVSYDDGATTSSTFISGISNIRNFAFEGNTKVYISTANLSGFQGNGVWSSEPPYTTWIQDGLDNLPVTYIISVDNSWSLAGCLNDINLIAGTNNGQVYFRNSAGQYTENSTGLSGDEIKSLVLAPKIYETGITADIVAALDPSSPGDPVSEDFDLGNCFWDPIEEIEDWINSRLAADWGPRQGNLKSSSQSLYIYYGTLGTGILRRDLLSTDVKNISSGIPDNYYLEQNYPNPFNPSTTMQFAIPKESFTRLEIFNALGEKVSTLVSETLSSGTYEYEWNAEGLSSGVYFYRLSTEKFAQTKKLLLMK